jgi:porin
MDLPMKIRSRASAIVMALLGSLAAPAMAAEFDARRYLSGDWNGARKSLAETGVQLRLQYINQTAHNVSGGDRRATAYADQIFAAGIFDLEALWGWKGAEFQIEVANRNGASVSSEAGIGALMGPQFIYGRGTVTRLRQFSITQRWLDDRLSLKAGRIHPGADFFGASCTFQNLTFCNAGVSNRISDRWFGAPLSALGAQVTFSPDARWFFRVGGYDANPQNLSKEQGLRLGTSGDDNGTLLVAEVEFRPASGSGKEGSYRLGVARNSSDLALLVNRAGYPAGTTADAVGSHDTDRALYASFEQQLTRNDAGGGLRLFGSVIRGDQRVTRIGEVISLGATYRAPFASRPNDRIGVAIGRASISSELTSAQRRLALDLPERVGAVGVQRHEIPIEVNYGIAVARGIELMPNIQHVRHPGGRDVSSATILGLQLNVEL